jgi:YesN/AraC family two-component response regulator
MKAKSMLKNFTLLVVDDCADTRSVINSLFKRLTKEIYFAKNGEEGLTLYKEHQPDIVLSDINMPKMNGLDMSQAIKTLNPKQPIVLFTAFEKIEYLKTAIELGIDRFLAKPIKDVEQLIGTLNDVAKNLHNEQEAIKYQNHLQQKEKVELLLKMTREISHHWRQPLNYITTLSSGASLKADNEMINEKELIETLDKITDSSQEMSSILDKINRHLKKLDLNQVTLEEIEEIIQISDPQYNSKI